MLHVEQPTLNSSDSATTIWACPKGSCDGKLPISYLERLLEGLLEGVKTFQTRQHFFRGVLRRGSWKVLRRQEHSFMERRTPFVCPRPIPRVRPSDQRSDVGPSRQVKVLPNPENEHETGGPEPPVPNGLMQGAMRIFCRSSPLCRRRVSQLFRLAERAELIVCHLSVDRLLSFILLAAQCEIPPHIAQYPFAIVSQRGVSHPFALFS